MLLFQKKKMSDEEEYEVEEVVSKRSRKGKIEYLVKWKGNIVLKIESFIQFNVIHRLGQP